MNVKSPPIGAGARVEIWRCYFFQCFETQTPESMPLPSDKSQKQPPGQLSLGAMQVVPHVALTFGFIASA
jgi:hypothetical protein